MGLKGNSSWDKGYRHMGVLGRGVGTVLVGERVIKGPEMIEVTNKKVVVAKEKLKEARTRQKSYADKHHRSLEFQPVDHVFLKVSPARGVRRFGIKGKLSPRFIGPFEILDRVGESHEEKDYSFHQDSLEEPSRARSHLGNRGVYSDFLSSFHSMICPGGIFINQSKYAVESLKKYGFESCDPVDTSMVEKSKLDEDKEGKAVDPSHYCAMDEALVLTAKRLRIGRSNFRLLSDIKSKESTLQLVYDVLDDFMFSTIKLVSRYQNTQQFGALLPIELTNDEIRNYKDYKEYYAIATGEAAPRPKASVRRTRISSDTSITPPTAAASPRLTASAKGKQTAKASKAKSLSALSEVAITKAQQLKLVTKQSKQQTYISQPSGSGADEGTEKDDDSDEEDEGDDGEEGDDDDADQEVVRDDDKDDDEEGGGMDSFFETTSRMDVHTPTSVAPLPITTPTMTSSTIATTTTTSQAPILSTTVLSDIIQNLPISALLGIVQHYMDQRMNEAVKLTVQIQSDRLRDEAQRENKEFLRTIDENIKKIIKEQVKEQVKAQVSKILPRIKHAVNEQLEDEVLTRSSYSSRTSYAIDADLSEMELKKILIEKMEGNNSIQRSDEQRNLYKALVDAYESDKIILDTYGETVTLKRSEMMMLIRMKNPPLDQIGGQRDAKKERSLKEPMQTTSQMEEPSHPEFDTADSRSSFNELMDTQAGLTYDLIKGSCKSLIELKYHLEEVYKAIKDQLDWVNLEGQQYPHNLLQPLPLIPNNRGRRVIPFEHFINNDLEYLGRGASSRKYTTSITKTKATDYGQIKWIKDLVPRTMWINEPIGYDKHAIWGVSHWGVNVSSSMVSLLTGSLLAMCIPREESLLSRNSRLSIVIQRRVEDLQMGVESYHNKLNLTKPDSYRFDLKSKEAYTTYSNPQGFIYQNKYKKNRLMRIDELHKFIDGTLTDVRTALDDRLKGIQMRY
nr:putative nucleotidyltransferase, ribonuclease H [Tanacetum cinerariifolium]